MSKGHASLQMFPLIISPDNSRWPHTLVHISILMGLGDRDMLPSSLEVLAIGSGRLVWLKNIANMYEIFKQ